MFRAPTFTLLLLFALPSTTRADEPFKLPADFETKAKEYMAARVKASQFSGVVLVALNGKPIFREAYGLANRDYDIPNAPTTKFRIGSVTKQFTSVVVLILEEQGKLNITDPISKHLPDCPKAWADVTIHQLMSHTGGIPEHTSLLFLSPGSVAKPYLPQQIIDVVKDKPLDFTPGEKFKYSNTGYDLLGMVIEAASGKKYDEFLQESIFTPLCMKDTGVEKTGMVLKNRATGYANGKPESSASMFVHMSLPFSAGSMYSTVDDMLLWSRALDANKLLNKKSTETLFTPVKDNYACGFVVGKKAERMRQGHGGAIPGFATALIRFPVTGLFVVGFSNADQRDIATTTSDLAAIAHGDKYELPKLPEPKAKPKDK